MIRQAKHLLTNSLWGHRDGSNRMLLSTAASHWPALLWYGRFIMFSSLNPDKPVLLKKHPPQITNIKQFPMIQTISRPEWFGLLNIGICDLFLSSNHKFHNTVIYKDQVKPKSLDTRFSGHDESRWHKRHSREACPRLRPRNGARSEAFALARNSHNDKQLGLSG